MTDPVAVWAGIGISGQPGFLPGYGSIDPNAGVTAFSLGVRAAHDVVSGTLPLWNHDEGLGAPLLGEMQSAALFPPTLLLLLPNGQMLEQCLLQAVAGLGTFLFLRRFGLGVGAALTGALLFECNGVFAWLRNAIFAPVAFLPWLLYTVETLFRLADEPGTRAPTIGIGALAAALSLYAGFPEIVYLYSLLLLGWVVARAVALPRRRALRFLADLAAVALLALIMAAPLLLAFLDYLAVADVGGHQGAGFADAYMTPPSFLALLLPYVYGPIFASPAPPIHAIWSSIGGYLGVMPLLLATGGLVSTRRVPILWLPAGWIVLAVGASLGIPVMHDAIIHVPFAALASYARYLNASWIFCCVILAACLIDRVDALDSRDRVRVGLIAAAVLVSLLAIGLVPAWPILPSAWEIGRWTRLLIAASAVGVVILLVGFLFALRGRHAGLLLSGLAVTEAFLAFLVPFASYPRGVRIDHALLDFLQRRAGLQRTAIASGNALAPNFGSAFAIPSINYDDLPVPRLTADFVQRHLDPDSDRLIFRPRATMFDAPTRHDAQRKRFLDALPAYAAAGVGYILSDDSPFQGRPYPLADGPAEPIPLASGQSITLAVAPGGTARTLAGLAVMVGTYRGAADGELRARLCQAERCAEGATPLPDAADNRPLRIAFGAAVTLVTDKQFSIALSKEGGVHDVALWTWPAGDATRMTGVNAPPGHVPAILEIGASDPVQVLQTETTNVFEAPGPRPYASAPGCRIAPISHDLVRASCDQPSRLLRLELFMPGWTARVNGVEQPVSAMEEVFQGVDLPAGESRIDFVFAPSYVRPLVPIALATVLLCLAVLLRAGWRSIHNETQREIHHEPT